MKINKTIALASLVGLFLLRASAILADTPDLAAARATDPNTLGWMVGSPPPPDKLIRFDDGTFYRFPQWRWSFSHWRELLPTVAVPRGAGPTQQFTSALRSDLDAVTFVPMGGTAPMTWADSLVANYTDGIVVLHRGRIVYERYFGALTAERPHIGFSVTKSFFGTLAAMLVADGVLDAAAPVKKYVPELADSGFGDATVAQILDMTTAIDFVENYTGESATMDRYRYATGFAIRPTGYQGPTSILAMLPTIGQERHTRHGVSLSNPERRCHRMVDRTRHRQIAVSGAERAHLEPHRCGGRRVSASGRDWSAPDRQRLERTSARFRTLRRADAPWRQTQRCSRSCRRPSSMTSAAAGAARRSWQAGIRRYPAGATTISGGSRTTIMACTWREASMARRSTSTRKPRW